MPRDFIQLKSCEIVGFYDADVDGGAAVQLIVTKYVCATLVPCCAD